MKNIRENVKNNILVSLQISVRLKIGNNSDIHQSLSKWRDTFISLTAKSLSIDAYEFPKITNQNHVISIILRMK